MSMDLRIARLRVKAKKFKRSIPANMALRMSDSLIDSINDEDIQDFLEILSQLGLSNHNGGYWERD